VTYRAYIKKDYKPEVRWVADRPWYLGKTGLLGAFIVSTLLIGTYSLYPDAEPPLVENAAAQVTTLHTRAEPADIGSIYIKPAFQLPTEIEFTAEAEDIVAQQQVPWQAIKVKKGDNLSIIFDRLGLGPTVLYQVMSLGDQTQLLKELMPGHTLDFLIEEGKLQALRFEPNLTTTLEVVKQDKGFSSNIIVTELELRTNESRGSIDSSLFIAGQRAGLSDNLIMQLVSIFGWDIDFALDIRSGDQFNVIYAEQYKDNIKVGEGPILAAEFINRNQSYRTVRYTSPDGDTNYFNQDGVSMRKAFLRTPLKFNRISSRFNLRRKHPILNRIRAHKGVDYSSPTGTPIKATGDGRVILAGTKGGYGRTVILKHGGTRSTLYAHMSSFARNVRKGKRVKQGQIIGYVGKTGLATGPHLHYEFRVNGVHRNPLTVKLPKASGVPAKYMADFKRKTATILAQLDSDTATKLAQQKSKDISANTVIALDDSNTGTSTVY
jgi:murein DD-endopeptidase MepM/ murein hydrolase activator NlpD